MYTNEDLELAVKQGIFSTEDVQAFRQLISEEKNTTIADEEGFRLISGFNDIYVVVACIILLCSSWWIFAPLSNTLAAASNVLISWGLAEFFVRRRKMALPAIVLLVSFVGAAYFMVFSPVKALINHTEWAMIIAAGGAAMAAYAHWLRFSVPITVAAGTLACISFAVGCLVSIFEISHWISPILFVAGIATFIFAMYWDSQDLRRLSRSTDIAFWLHLTAAPLIIHPVFSSLGIFDNQGNSSTLISTTTSTIMVVALYIVMTIISVIIDRRAFMVSALFYVIYAVSTLFKKYGFITENIALTGIIISSALLLLSAFWDPVRRKLLALSPAFIRRRVPA